MYKLWQICEDSLKEYKRKIKLIKRNGKRPEKCYNKSVSAVA